jgi:hypothetical protein
MFFLLPKLINYLACQSCDFECTCCNLFHKRVVRTKFDIYVFIEGKIIKHFYKLHIPGPTGATSEAGTAHPSGAHGFTPGF